MHHKMLNDVSRDLYFFFYYLFVSTDEERAWARTAVFQFLHVWVSDGTPHASTRMNFSCLPFTDIL